MWYIVVVPDSEPDADGSTVDVPDSVCIDGLSFSVMCEVPSSVRSTETSHRQGGAARDVRRQHG